MMQPLLISRKVGSTNFLSNSTKAVPTKVASSHIETAGKKSVENSAARTNKKKDKMLSRLLQGRENADPDNCERFSRLIIHPAAVVGKTPCSSSVSSSYRTPKAFRNQGVFVCKCMFLWGQAAKTARHTIVLYHM